MPERLILFIAWLLTRDTLDWRLVVDDEPFDSDGEWIITDHY